ncbi:hypothetical protein [Paraflavitalea speifideaquila]|uniref:hypothetical protein n=1 Tax=Paraflavitalea speifideaquila TaxID=3076558 RepID=UPI0028EE7FC3|nr:hypothetical protein [Paraflavitalea speifideiaquila]
MTALLEEFKQEAIVRIKEVTDASDAHINYLNEQIGIGKSRIDELKEKLKLADLYKEEEDEVLKKLIAEKDSQEKELSALRDRLTDVRIKLGEAKAGIIDRSLADAEAQVKKP